MFTDGDNEDSKGFVSVYLFCDQPNVGSGKYVSLSWKVEFVNHLCDHLSIQKDFQQKFPLNPKSGSGWGNRKSLKSSEITKLNGFVDNKGSLLIRCSFCIDDVEWLI